MSALCLSLADELREDFSRARSELIEARRRGTVKDTPAHRDCVAHWLAVIDTVLDMYLDTRAPARALMQPA